MGALNSAASTAMKYADPLGITNGTAAGKLSGRGPMSGLIGQGGGAAGTGFAAPQQASIQQGTSVQDVQGAQARAGDSLQGQQALLDALKGQNGLGQQNIVAQQQQGLNAQLNAANGIGTQNQAIQGLHGAAGMYQNIAEGKGPNPAQAMLNQATGQNVSNQAALMAGQRGAGSNVGLMARQAAQQGAGIQQQAVGQGATMQANQQVNALSGLVNANQTMGGLGTNQLSAQQAQQQAMANQANVVAGQQIAGTTANTQANLANQQQMQGALQGINNASVNSQGNVNTGNAALANTQMQGQQGLVGGLLQGVGSVAGAALARGGVVHHMADGGMPGVAPPAAVPAATSPPPGPTSSFGQFLKDWSTEGPASQGASVASGTEGMGGNNPGAKALNEGAAGFSSMGATSKKPAGGGGSAGVLKALGPTLAAKGGLADSGGHVTAKNPAQKAVKSGDSYDNDKVPAKLSEGEIVLPRSVTMSSDPVTASAEFVRKVLEKRKAK